MYDMNNIESITIPFHGGKERKISLFERRDKNGNHMSPATSCVIYGPNGSGKSTTAKALRDDISNVKFHDAEKELIQNSQTSNINNIYVYDDYYIQNNFRQVDSEEIAPIILLGQVAKDLDQEDILRSELQKLQEQIDQAHNELEKQEKSLNNAENSIKTALTKSTTAFENGWQPRTALYRENRTKTRLSQNVIPEFAEEAIKYLSASQENHKTRYESLKSKFQQVLKTYQEIKKISQISWKPPILPQINFAEIKQAIKDYEKQNSQAVCYDSTIAEQIGKLGLTPEDLKTRISEIFDPKLPHCPTCFQEISSDFAKLAIQAIDSQIKAMENDSLRNNLESKLISWFPKYELPDEFNAGAEIAEKLKSNIAELAELIDSLNKNIQTKLARPLDEVDVNQKALEQKIEDIKSYIHEYENLVSNRNRAATKLNSITDDLDNINRELAYFEIDQQAQIWKTQVATHQHSSIEYENVRSLANAKEKELNDLLSRNRSSKEAADKINELLRITIGSNNLQVEARPNGYIVINRNATVTPGSLSTGERNLLSLCYFITEIANHKKFNDAFKENQLIIFDDPISSFDHDNKYGILSVISWFAEKCLSGKSKSRVCVFTHDLNIAQQISTIFKSFNGDHNDCIMTFDNFKQIQFSDVDYYRDYLREMYNLATKDECATNNDVAPIDANHIRRVWEGFVKFMLNANISDASKATGVKELFSNSGPAYEAFLNRYPGKTLINTDSHSAIQVTFGDPYLLPTLLPSDYKRFTREILCFIQIIAPWHIASRLETKNNQITKINAEMNELVREVIEG